MGKIYKIPKRKLTTNVVYCADNLEVMKTLPGESIDLIYIDPPFNTGTVRKSKAWDNEVQLGDFDDKWGGGINSYILWMTNRLREMHRLLKPTGVLCVHLDYKSVHYIKVELDKIFGQGSTDRGSDHLVNEIIWYFNQGGGRSKNNFKNRHNHILIYSKKKKYIFNEKDLRLPFTPHKQSKSGKNFGGVMGIDENGREFVEKWGTGKKKKYRYYLDEGKSPESVWTDIQSLQSAAKERVNNRWATQKPIALLERIIKAFTNKDHIVADFFCGCGTTISASESLGRKWIGVDVSKDASQVIRKRMTRDHNLDVDILSLKSLTKEEILSLDPFEFEKYCVRSIGGIPNDIQRGDGGTDGYLIEDGTPIQVKMSERVGRTVIDSFHKHLQKNGKGVIIAKSFGRGAKEEVARLRLKEGYEVTLVTIDDILREAA